MLNEPWHVQLLGGIVASRNELRVERFRTRKVAVLLAYLALHNRVSTSREYLCELMWPEEEEAVSRNRLRVTLANLRKQLELPTDISGCVLVANRSQVYLREGSFTTDVDQFRRSVASANLIKNETSRADAFRNALDTYNGELLPEVYEDWVVGERSAIEHLYHQTASSMIELLCSLGNAGESLPYAIRLAQMDPLDERAHCRLIQVYAELGQPGNAADVFHALRDRLQNELGVEPAVETTKLFASLRRVPAIVSNSANLQPVNLHLASPYESSGQLEESHSIELPSSSSSFHGRESDLQLLKSILSPNLSRDAGSTDGTYGRLITLTGLGGIGKTRLGLQAAVQSAPNFPGGAWFVPLADVEDGRSVGRAIADVLRIKFTPHKNVLDQLVDDLRARTTHGPALLLLDNYEHLVGQSTGVVEILLARVPALWFVTTSRRLLGIPAEREFRVEPLDVPGWNPGADQVIADAVKSASVALFVARAKAIHPEFRITAENVLNVVELSRKLEGIPLAIELAAARIRLLTPGQMISEMEQRFDLLVNRRASKASRHGSLRGAIARSVQMLPLAVRDFFAMLSVFRGSWNLDSARAVTDCSDVLDKLDELAGFSLIQTRSGDFAGETRYSMLESIREYAAAMLPLDQLTLVSTAHAKYYSLWAETRELITLSSHRGRVLTDYELEKENIRAAWTWALHHEPERAMNIAANLRWIYFVQHRLREGEQMLLQSIQRGSSNHTEAEARALISVAALRCYMDDFAGAAEPLRAGTELLSPHQGRERRLATLFRGWITMHEGNFDGALELLNEARILCGENGESWDEGACYNLMGFAACYAGRLTQARELFEASRHGFERAGDFAIAFHCLLGTGRAAWMDGKFDEAESLYRTALSEFRLHRDRRGIAYALEGLARIASNKGLHIEAMRLTGASQQVRDRFALKWDPPDQAAHDSVIAAAVSAMEDLSRKAAWDHGYSLGEEAVDEPGVL